ncbi:MAG: hypothetical protein JW860_10225, partial [Sedimentisphaerales bacterium]|nr:hypothetical protein [Sedimentisphaerales bacterium]
MEDNLYINLSDCVIGHNELNFLLKHWLNDPLPKTINELAKIYLTKQIENQTKLIPYDRRKCYNIKDKIAIFIKQSDGKKSLEPAEVINVSRHHKDPQGYSFEKIEIKLLSMMSRLTNSHTKTFIANYHGEEYAGPAVSSLEIISENDEKEVIPKILMAISEDNRFVNYEKKWLSLELIDKDIPNKIDLITKIFAQHKYPLHAKEILSLLFNNENNGFEERLVFSLNYYLNSDNRFAQILDSESKWDLNKPHDSIEIIINNDIFFNNKLIATPVLKQLLLYHGFYYECTFCFPANNQVIGYLDTESNCISGNNFIEDLQELSLNGKSNVIFKHPHKRGDSIRVSTSDIDLIGHVDQKQEWTIVVRESWIEKGILKIPYSLARYLIGSNIVRILNEKNIVKIVPYKESDRII